MYRSRDWAVILAGIPIAIWLFTSASDVGRVHAPPSAEAPAMDVMVPVAGAHRRYQDRFSLHVAVQVRDCRNPVRVFAQLTGPPMDGARDWLDVSAPVRIGVVGDRRIHDMRAFGGQLVASASARACSNWTPRCSKRCPMTAPCRVAA